MQPRVLKCTQQHPAAVHDLPSVGSAQADDPGVQEAVGSVSEHVGWGGGPKLRHLRELGAGPE